MRTTASRRSFPVVDRRMAARPQMSQSSSTPNQAPTHVPVSRIRQIAKAEPALTRPLRLPRAGRGFVNLLFALAAVAAPAFGQTDKLVSNTGQTYNSAVSASVGTSTVNGVAIHAKHAQWFTTGDSDTGYTLSTVALHISVSGLSSDAVPRVSVYSATPSNTPDSLLYELVNPATIAADALNTFTAPSGATLDAQTDYLIVMESVLGRYRLHLAGSNAEDPGSATGWETRYRLRSLDNGPWEASTGVFRVELHGTIHPAASTVDGALGEHRIWGLDNGAGFEGRLEVRRNGRAWGTVCDDRFADREAQVACKLIGYTGGEVYSVAHYAEATGRIWLDDVRCVNGQARPNMGGGAPVRLSDCYHAGWGLHNCQHSEDVGIRCGPKIAGQSVDDEPSVDEDEDEILYQHIVHSGSGVRPSNGWYTLRYGDSEAKTNLWSEFSGDPNRIALSEYDTYGNAVPCDAATGATVSLSWDDRSINFTLSEPAQTVARSAGNRCILRVGTVQGSAVFYGAPDAIDGDLVVEFD